MSNYIAGEAPDLNHVKCACRFGNTSGRSISCAKVSKFVLRVCNVAALTNLIRSLLKQARFVESAIDFHTSAAAFVTNEFKGLSPVASGL